MKICDIARQEVGYMEKKTNAYLDSKIYNVGSNNYTKYGDWYGLNGEPWCAMFVSWCANQAGIDIDIFPKHASCTVGVNWFKKRGLWKEPTGYTPKEGDVIYFSQKGKLAHVGLVVAINKDIINTVEGNTFGTFNTVSENGGSVCLKSYRRDNTNIYGFGTPMYEQEEEEVEFFKTINDVPDWAKYDINLFVKDGIISDAENINLTEEGMRILIMASRMINKKLVLSE
jgi:hypothetical protein